MPEARTRPNFNRYPMLWLAAAFAAGILAANLTNIDLSGPLAVCAVFAILAVIFRGQHFASILMLIAFIGAGAASVQIEKLSITPDRLRVLYDNGTIRSGDPVERQFPQLVVHDREQFFGGVGVTPLDGGQYARHLAHKPKDTFRRVE